MADFNLKKGYTIRITGEAANEVADASAPARVAIKPIEFRGIVPKLNVEIGSEVLAGAALFHSKRQTDYLFTSPVSGKVVEINRGARRVMESIVIEVDGQDGAVEFDKYAAGELAGMSRDQLLPVLMKSGMLAIFRERPFDYVADPDNTPRDIFVSTLNTAPLTADPALLVQGNEEAFQAGLDVAGALTSGKVHLAVDGSRKDVPSAFSQAKNAQVHRFSGKHPAGTVGVQIHHISPIKGRTDVVWYATVQGLITLGRFFLNGRVVADTVVAVAGSAAKDRKHFRTTIGAQLSSLIQGNVDAGELRYIAGDVLTGRNVGADGYVGFYDNTVTVIPEATEAEFMGWCMPGAGKASFYRGFLSSLMPGKKFALNTCINGGHRAFITTGNYERVLPIDMYPVSLMKSILAQDIDEMEGLGIYEVTEEEIALCEYICPSKNEWQKILRDGLNLIEKEG